MTFGLYSNYCLGPKSFKSYDTIGCICIWYNKAIRMWRIKGQYSALVGYVPCEVCVLVVSLQESENANNPLLPQFMTMSTIKIKQH